jgi:hypothetical protein
VSCIYRNRDTAHLTASTSVASATEHLVATAGEPSPRPQSTSYNSYSTPGIPIQNKITTATAAQIENPQAVGHLSSHSVQEPLDQNCTISAPPSQDDILQQAERSASLNMLHLELLHNMVNVNKSFHRDSPQFRQAFDTSINLALRTPFLMHELLAVSALQLSTSRPSQKEVYTEEAANLQVQALTIFNNLPTEYNITNPVPVFLFSSLLGIHVLFDTLLFRPEDFGLFIDRFVGYLRLHRGVITMSSGSFSMLQNSEFAPLLGGNRWQDNQPPPSRNECAQLKTLMKSADLGPTSIKACLDAIERLQQLFNRYHLQLATQDSDIEGEDSSELIFAWPITISAEFTQLLLQRKPEALAVLAHYAVLLCWKKDNWVVRDGGAWLIGCIARYLGASWEKWLDLPMATLQDNEP